MPPNPPSGNLLAALAMSFGQILDPPQCKKLDPPLLHYEFCMEVYNQTVGAV